MLKCLSSHVNLKELVGNVAEYWLTYKYLLMFTHSLRRWCSQSFHITIAALKTR